VRRRRDGGVRPGRLDVGVIKNGSVIGIVLQPIVHIVSVV
jgi:hypothetical protein